MSRLLEPDTVASAGGGGTATRAGYVTLVGRPNAGKSTLLNALIGEHLSIVTSRPQTTWERVAAIDTRGDAQMIFLDTPGLLDPRDLMQRAMLATALEALHEADVVLAVVDAATVTDEELGELGGTLATVDAPRMVAVNKTDVAEAGRIAAVEDWATWRVGARAFRVSALRLEGLDPLRSAIEAALPPGPFLFAPDEIATRPVRFFVAELVRETVFQLYYQEIPYSAMCRVDEFREGGDPVYVAVTVFVERASQKGILIGKKGEAIKALGQASRVKISHFLGRPVYLDLWVKVLPGWRRKRAHLVRLGFHVPEEDDEERR
jgi:GTP-binding protein Era